MMLPPRIKNGDRIGIVSTSYPYATLLRNRTERAIKNLEKIGFNIVIGDSVYKKTGYTSGSAEERAKDINKMFQDKKVAAIICVNGGHTTNQILDLLDYNLIKKNPKIIIGFSDATSLLLAVNKICNIVTYHGPMLISQFGEYPDVLEYTKKSFLKAITKNETQDVLPSKEWTDEFLDSTKGEDIRSRKMKNNNSFEFIKEGYGEGKLIGGNLRIITGLAGTKYFPDFTNSIFFWEDSGISVDEIDRNLTHLKMLGVFDKIKGMVVGRVNMLKEKDGVGLKELLNGKFKEYNFPVLIGADFGHTDPVLTIPIGVNSLINSKEKRWLIQKHE